jgi:hypothetical protein
MKPKLRIPILLLFCSFTIWLQGQESTSATGGNASGTGGTVTYTVGQVACSFLMGTSATINQGVQQPYEISIVSGLENLEGINLECSVYPNPAGGQIKLKIKSDDYENFRFHLYDSNGVLLIDRKVDSEETTITIENLSPSVFLLKVVRKNVDVKVFKIIKK